MSEPAQRPVRSFVLRQGRMTEAQRRALSDLFARHGVEYRAQPLDFDILFGRRAPRVLEVGCGMGETTAAIAQANPAIDYLAVEVHLPGVGSLLRRIEAAGLANVRVLRHDAVEVVRDMIPPASLTGVHVFFPDPWPKKRHHKRRLLKPPFVRSLAERLAPGGYLHVATDWLEYAAEVLTVLDAEPLLVNRAGLGYSERPAHRPLTKFEQRGIALGHEVRDLVFERRAS